jgi:hypothetical protein
MKFLALFFFLVFGLSLSAQKTLDVKLILKYRNNPLCNWDVTIKHGDATIAKSKSNEKGEVTFKNATVYSLSIDAYGYKAFQGGDKKWDVKGYIQLNEQGFASFDFEPLVKETGMPASMLEAAWGLTISDCGQVASTPKSEEKSTTASPTKTEEKKTVEEVEEEKYSVEDMQQDMKAGMDNMKLMQENKIANLNSKIEKKTVQRNGLDAKSKEYSKLSYEIKDLELEREISKIKLEKVNLQISKGYKPLNKTEKVPLDDREDALSEEQKLLKKKEKEGYFYGTSELIESSKPKAQEESQAEEKTEKPEKKAEKSEKEEAKVEETNEKEARKFYTESELAEMSVFALKKYKMELNTSKMKLELNLKTKNSIFMPDEIEQFKADLSKIESQILLIDTELQKRSETKE